MTRPFATRSLRAAVSWALPCLAIGVSAAPARADGAASGPRRERDRWAIEAAAGFIARRTDEYTSRLSEFGYEPGALSLPSPRITLGASRVLVPHLAGVVQAGTLAGDRYQRSIGGETDTVSFQSYGAALYLRSFTDLAAWFGVYGQAGAGVGLGVVNLETQQTGVPPSTRDTSFGYLLSGAIGCTADLPRVVSLFLQGGYDYAPVIHDLIGDTHDGGGFSVALGVRLRLGDDR